MENEYYPIIGRWETSPAVMDTAWAMTPREADDTAEPAVVAKHATEYFEYVDRGIHNGFIYFYSVTATDHALLPDGKPSGIDLPVGPGFSGDPGCLA